MCSQLKNLSWSFQLTGNLGCSTSQSLSTYCLGGILLHSCNSLMGLANDQCSPEFLVFYHGLTYFTCYNAKWKVIVRTLAEISVTEIHTFSQLKKAVMALTEVNKFSILLSLFATLLPIVNSQVRLQMVKASIVPYRLMHCKSCQERFRGGLLLLPKPAKGTFSSHKKLYINQKCLRLKEETFP